MLLSKKADGLNLKFCHTERSEVSQSKSFEILPTVRMTNTIDYFMQTKVAAIKLQGFNPN